MKKLFLIMTLLVMSGCMWNPPYVSVGVSTPVPVYRGYYNRPHRHQGFGYYNRGWRHEHRGWHGR